MTYHLRLGALLVLSAVLCTAPTRTLAQSPETDSTRTVASSVLDRVGTTSGAATAGYERFQLWGFDDLTPFQGQHWIREGLLGSTETDLERPPFLMFAPVDGEMVPVGVAYGFTAPESVPTPSTLAGYEVAWHEHQWCRRIPGEGRTLAHSRSDCLERGGRPEGDRTTMVHVWTIESPDGLYAHDNPLLPFVSNGMTGEREHFHGETSREARLFALGLGEAYGALLPYARRISATIESPEVQASISEQREAIRSHVPGLREAESGGDGATYDRLRAEVIAAYERLLELYRANARTEQLRAQLDRELEMAVSAAHGGHAGHHGG